MIPASQELRLANLQQMCGWACTVLCYRWYHLVLDHLLPYIRSRLPGKAGHAMWDRPFYPQRDTNLYMQADFAVCGRPISHQHA